jgi:hypothetical protein
LNYLAEQKKDRRNPEAEHFRLTDVAGKVVSKVLA